MTETRALRLQRLLSLLRRPDGTSYCRAISVKHLVFVALYRLVRRPDVTPYRHNTYVSM
jgi:hypothetical protein